MVKRDFKKGGRNRSRPQNLSGHLSAFQVEPALHHRFAARLRLRAIEQQLPPEADKHPGGRRASSAERFPASRSRRRRSERETDSPACWWDAQFGPTHSGTEAFFRSRNLTRRPLSALPRACEGGTVGSNAYIGHSMVRRDSRKRCQLDHGRGASVFADDFMSEERKGGASLPSTGARKSHNEGCRDRSG